MDIYLPIAGLSVNALVIIGLGGLVGLLTGMVGVGGGFLTTPILIFYGIPPAVAVASTASQITGTSISGVLAHRRRRGVDVQMGAVLIFGGVLGSIFGGFIFRLLQQGGQIDTVISILYVLLLGSIGLMMAKEAATALGILRRGEAGEERPPRRHNPVIALLPMRWRFYRSGLYISPLAPLLLGFVSGLLTVLLGIGGGFIMVPAMIYLLGMSATVVVGTSLLQILFVTAVTTLVHATTTRSVDIVLAGLLLFGSVIGAQYGAWLAQKMKPELLRMILAIVVLGVALRMALQLGWRPEEIYTVQIL
ncbi:sulfite exporter TauE/SafE family protein [Sphingosinicella sp. LHD-64]|uniref:sulfite exporter TauE/SafE family protein n=1 Tax=Sphingosinicella sp. LHD-64 TaxID=3072139 RepID=UPI00280DF680|nr:sulfite exporter TauE/SafE family protein [Sphingosinicella sp. LHD-64]MDQ8756653.1 sulfite exporter TauE/SafE family protein [Sphingosinicella sp. LHD-64]